jgi:hypothetical protein
VVFPDQEAQFLYAREPLRNAGEGGQEEIAHGEASGVRGAQNAVDVVHEPLVAVVDDVVGGYQEDFTISSGSRLKTKCCTVRAESQARSATSRAGQNESSYRSRTA